MNPPTRKPGARGELAARRLHGAERVVQLGLGRDRLAAEQGGALAGCLGTFGQLGFDPAVEPLKRARSIALWSESAKRRALDSYLFQLGCVRNDRPIGRLAMAHRAVQRSTRIVER